MNQEWPWEKTGFHPSVAVETPRTRESCSAPTSLSWVTTLIFWGYYGIEQRSESTSFQGCKFLK